ncbi:hypothetical protein CDL12_03737 [Handroanthus impetiginosus]|uniref:Ubiquitinyl hydrolase 1 n=1 Tax=Handroanthus impetiginosus TaxID=429701 RepID=A0A2G9I1A5_9LAMI|nr:hypothetical protein CDL12_03737 [Handroanthus impetiginosus]
MGHCCIVIPRPRDEEVCRGRKKSEEISRRLHCWVDGTTQKLIEFSRLYRWGECKRPNKVHDTEDRLKSITAEMVFEFNPTSQELCLLNLDSAVAVILKKRVAELEAAVNKDLCVVAPAKVDATATKEQRDRGAACEEQGNNDEKEKERKYEEEEDEEDEEMDEERKDDEEEEEEKVERDEQKEEKTKEGQNDRKGEKEDGEDEEGNEKEGEKEEERKDSDDDEERDHDADNEHNVMNEENQTKHHAGQVSCHHEVEMNKNLEAISRNLDSPLSTTPAKRAKKRNEESDHGKEKKTIPEQEKADPLKKKKLSDLKLNVKAFEKYT